MDDRQEPGRDDGRRDRNAPSAPRSDDRTLNGRHESGAGERTTADRSSSGKAALTDRERRERWPVD
jgi:hypothetical protein